MAGSSPAIDHFFRALDSRFKLGQMKKGNNLKCLCCLIHKDDFGNIYLSMSDYIDKIDEPKICKSWRTQTSDYADASETQAYRSLAGALLYLGQAVLPQACFVASGTQQRLGHLLVSDIIERNMMLRAMKRLNPWITFRKPSHVTNIEIWTLSDASNSSGNEA